MVEALSDERMQLEKQRYVYEQHIAGNKRQNLIKKACLAIVKMCIRDRTESGEVNCYLGNYSDYAEKRKEPPAVEKTKASPKKGFANGKRSVSQLPKKLKFTFREEREYETIDADLAALEKQIAGCSKEITAAASDYVRLQELMTQKESLEVQLEQKTERWVMTIESATHTTIVIKFLLCCLFSICVLLRVLLLKCT